MKVHKSVIEKILYMVRTYGGYENETKLKKHLESIDLTPYDRKATGETILVLTEEYIKQLSGNKNS